MTTQYTRFETPLGTMFAVATDGEITRLDFTDAKYVAKLADDAKEDRDDPALASCARQVAEYFAGERDAFDLPFAPQGTDFQKRIWREIAKVRFGKTITYSELARRAGAEGSARAAGAATGRNPIAVAIPCHRIVGADGSLTGYAGGLPRKTKLLELEGVLQGVAQGPLI
jgi:methylated-DNA-[protein]-cysteine S-methyltransferase